MRTRKSNDANYIIILLKIDSTINNTSLIDNLNAPNKIQVAYKSRFTKYAKNPIVETSSFQLSEGPHELAKSDMEANE